MRGGINKEIYLRILLLISILYLFFKLGVSFYLIIFLGSIALLFIFLRGKFYKKSNKFMTKKFPYFSKLHPTIKKIIIVAVFILIYFILKETIYFILRMFGIDIQKMIFESVSNSIAG
jgi:hypothetical protein